MAFGNSYNDEERCLAAGYDNGDVKVFDLRTGTVRFETNVKNGVRTPRRRRRRRALGRSRRPWRQVCGIEFDRKEIPMNKFVATCLESQFTVWASPPPPPPAGAGAAGAGAEEPRPGAQDARTQHPKKGMASLACKTEQGATLWGVKHLPQNREARGLAAAGAGDQPR